VPDVRIAFELAQRIEDGTREQEVEPASASRAVRGEEDLRHEAWARSA
jgi:hypothetical protein